MYFLDLPYEVLVAICQYTTCDTLLGLRATCRHLGEATRVCFSTECLSTDLPFLTLRLKCNGVLKKDVEMDYSQLGGYGQNGLRFWLSRLQIHRIDARPEDCERLLRPILRAVEDVCGYGIFHVVLPNCLSLRDPESCNLISYINNCSRPFTVEMKLSGDSRGYIVLGGKFVQLELDISEQQLLKLEPDSESALDSLNICGEGETYSIKSIFQTLENFTHGSLRNLRLSNVKLRLEVCSLGVAVKVNCLEISHCSIEAFDVVVGCPATEVVIKETDPKAVFTKFKFPSLKSLSISCQAFSIEDRPQVLDKVLTQINSLSIAGPSYRQILERPAFIECSISSLSLVISELDWMKTLDRLNRLKQLTDLTMTLCREHMGSYNDEVQIKEMVKEVARRLPALTSLDFKIAAPSDCSPPMVTRIKLNWPQLPLHLYG